MNSPVDTKCGANVAFGNDAKSPLIAFLDAQAAAVDTKTAARRLIGNDTAAFVRIRTRKLMGGIISKSFDLVHAVRVDGKPRHQFLLGLGSQKTPPRYGDVLFWYSAFQTMLLRGISPERCRRIADEMARKGARKVALDVVLRAYDRNDGRRRFHDQTVVDEIATWLMNALVPQSAVDGNAAEDGGAP